MNSIISEFRIYGPFKRTFKIKILSFVLSFLMFPIVTAANNNQLHREDLGTKEQVDFYISQMTLEQKISQLLIFGFAGKKYNQSMGPRLRSFSPGGMIVFQRNIKTPWELGEMNLKAQEESIKATGLPAFIMIDQEGGQVTRIKTTPPAPSALALGNTENPELVRNVGFVTGRILELTGVNMNLAPVMDLTDPTKRSFIGNRSFGNSPMHVSRMARSFSQGLVNGGVIPAAKHFPGHGGIAQDSHKGTTTKRDSLEVLKNRDLVPFQSFVKDNPISAVMVAHVAYPDLDPSLSPATYSKPIVTNLLRDQMGYNGIVITDDLEMLGAAKAGTIEERAIKAIEAGVDMIMIAWSRKKQIRARNSLINAVKTGRLSKARINDSLRRIVRAKLAIKKSIAQQQSTLANRKKQLKFYAEELKILTRKVSKLNFEKNLRKYSAHNISVPQDLKPYVFAADGDFFNSFKREFSGKSSFVPLTRKFDGNVRGYLSKDPKRVAIFYATGTLSAKYARKIHPSVRDRVFIVNTTYPGLITDPETYGGVFDINTRDYRAGKWIAEFMNYESQRQRGPAGSDESVTSMRGQ